MVIGCLLLHTFTGTKSLVVALEVNNEFIQYKVDNMMIIIILNTHAEHTSTTIYSQCKWSGLWKTAPGENGQVFMEKIELK